MPDNVAVIAAVTALGLKMKKSNDFYILSKHSINNKEYMILWHFYWYFRLYDNCIYIIKWNFLYVGLCMYVFLYVYLYVPKYLEKYRMYSGKRHT